MKVIFPISFVVQTVAMAMEEEKEKEEMKMMKNFCTCKWKMFIKQNASGCIIFGDRMN